MPGLSVYSLILIISKFANVHSSNDKIQNEGFAFSVFEETNVAAIQCKGTKLPQNTQTILLVNIERFLQTKVKTGFGLFEKQLWEKY